MNNSNPQNKLKNFDFYKNTNDLPKNFKFRFIKSKNLDIHLANYIPSSVDRIKGGISPKSKNVVPVKIKEKKYFVDTQNNIMDMNIIKNYYKVFLNEEKHLYTDEHIRNISNLLYKNKKNYFTKRNQSQTNKEDRTNVHKNSIYITNFPETNTEFSIKQKVNRVERKSNFLKEDDLYSLSDTYDSNMIIELTNNQKEKIKNKLNNEYNFYKDFGGDAMINYNKPNDNDLTGMHNLHKLPFKIRKCFDNENKKEDLNHLKNNLTSLNNNTRISNTAYSTSAYRVTSNRSESPIKNLLNNLKCLKEFKIKYTQDSDYANNNIRSNNPIKKI